MRERDYPPDPHDRAQSHLRENIVAALKFVALLVLSVATGFLGSIWADMAIVKSDIRDLNTRLNERVIRQVDANTAINAEQGRDIEDLKRRMDRVEAEPDPHG